jgi:peptide/nickel transport system ATP-binding protein
VLPGIGGSTAIAPLGVRQIAIVNEHNIHTPTAAPLLKVHNLGVSFASAAGEVQVTQGIDLELAPGERVGLVGESGCGKTVTGLALMRLLPRGAARVTGSVWLGDTDLMQCSVAQMNAVRGRRMGMIFQEPMTALDPVFSVGHQISETVRTHFRVSWREAVERAVAALDAVGIPSARARFHDYPHQLSGGMRQRALIAIAIACEPSVLIADEPTTALDVTIQAQIVELLLELSQRQGMAMLFITHNLGVVADCCERVITMYAGQIIEDARVDELLTRPLHPYSSALLHSVPRGHKSEVRLSSIPGRVPAPSEWPNSCRFADRCPHVRPVCTEHPVPLRNASMHHDVRCVRSNELQLEGVVR